ncbi:unnamed protein product [Rotaria sordida]|uniref:Uncharacterized protein n=1 Tax=Rotaria sordida TaxID=392033 RepID=A0A818WVD8_9BILA|nr:unnamed protein product [Rotaria sordida]CAF3729046.1 unnamed protein product [Rotaria sordida]
MYKKLFAIAIAHVYRNEANYGSAPKYYTNDHLTNDKLKVTPTPNARFVGILKLEILRRIRTASNIQLTVASNKAII